MGFGAFRSPKLTPGRPPGPPNSRTSAIGRCANILGRTSLQIPLTKALAVFDIAKKFWNRKSELAMGFEPATA